MRFRSSPGVLGEAEACGHVRRCGAPDGSLARLDGTINGMDVTIDAVGRIVVPKALRDQLCLRGGTKLTVRVREGRLELEPAPAAMRLERRGKGLVATSDEPLPPLDADDVRQVIEAQRR